MGGGAAASVLLRPKQQAEGWRRRFTCQRRHHGSKVVLVMARVIRSGSLVLGLLALLLLSRLVRVDAVTAYGE